MKKGQLVVAFILEMFGIWIIIDSYRLGLQTFRDPGSGLFPFVCGILLCLLLLPICINAIKNLKKDSGRTDEKEAGHRGLKEVSVVLACLIGYFVFLYILGFIITTTLFMCGLLWMGNPRRRLFVLTFSLVVAILSYIIFDVLLQTPFPSGFLGIG